MILTIGNSKGGVGKTTLATNLAVAFARDGYKLLLLDADPQASTADWASERHERGHDPAITCAQRTGAKIGGDLRRYEEGHDLVIVDTGGRNSLELRAALALTDLVVVPVVSSQIDLWASAHIYEPIEEVQAINEGLRVLAVTSRATTHPRVQDTLSGREIYSESFPDGFRLAETIIYERIAYRRAVEEGQAVHEYGQDSKASEEMTRLYEEVLRLAEQPQ